ncbi:MAG: hypothetical protein ABR548_04895 [Actinomycetota bacterium]|nr:hypothetical protein [Actinomycetota bacterium]
MSDSNVDWGQDLRRLGADLEQSHASQTLWILYSGSARPIDYGIQRRPVLGADPKDVHGIVAASVTALNSYYGHKFDYVKEGKLIRQIGHSILIYELP